MSDTDARAEIGSIRRIDAGEAQHFTQAVFEAYGASGVNAQVVAEHLVGSERRGLPSHGLIRVSQYVDEIRSGRLDPGATPSVSAPAPASAVVDGHWTFGPVAGMYAMNLVEAQVSDHGIGFASVKHVQHTGRLGAYTEPLAAKGYLTIAFGAGAPRFHRVAPFGGRQGRMSTNPISWAVPALGEDPIVADFSTSVMPEGRVRVLQAADKPIPPEVICDFEGHPSTDPRAFYGTPPWSQPGFLLPLGGTQAGHKGYALALLAECMATLMSGEDVDDHERGNNLAILALRGDSHFAERTATLARYMRAATPADPERPVLMPGDIERTYSEQSTSIPVTPTTWHTLLALAEPAGLPAPPIVAPSI